MLDEFLVYLIDLEILAFNLHLGTLKLFDESLEFSGVILIEGARNTMMFALESENSIKDHMKLLWNTEFIPTCNWHLSTIGRIRISETFF